MVGKRNIENIKKGKGMKIIASLFFGVVFAAIVTGLYRLLDGGIVDYWRERFKGK